MRHRLRGEPFPAPIAVARWLQFGRVVTCNLLLRMGLLASLSGCSTETPPEPMPEVSGVVSETVIHQPEKLTSIETGEVDALGRPVRIACGTCHSLKTKAQVPTSPTELTEFHTGLSFDHGAVSCASCHVSEAGKAPRLRLADGRTLPMEEAMTLCGQCHGPQLRDYKKGSHGGMSGKWDLSRGERLRNHCVDCHDPHVPQIAPVLPAPRMKDRPAMGLVEEKH